MKVRVLYFASVRDVCGHGEEVLELPGVATVGTLQGILVARYPALESRVDSLRYARNEVFAPLTEVVQEGDTVAVIPPVSGG